MRELTDSAQSYFAAALGAMSDVNWMAVGAAILLVARLVQDVPKAIETIIEYRKRRKKRE